MSSIDKSIQLEELSVKKQYSDDTITAQKALAYLPESYKTIIVLRDIQNLSYLEIADITESSLGSVKSILACARLQLKNNIIENNELSKHKIV
jgi:RNA polymerase sigma-70 factor (ECF subfamily)